MFDRLAGLLRRPQGGMQLNPVTQSVLAQQLLQNSMQSPQGLVSPSGVASKILQGLLAGRTAAAQSQQAQTTSNRQQALAGALSRAGQAGPQGEAAKRAALIISGGLPGDPMAEKLLGAQAQSLFPSEDPAGSREFDRMVNLAGLTPEEQQRAARVDLGLEPRAVSMRERQPPVGYEWNEDGTLKATPGGPADPSGPNLRRNSTALRKEYEDQPVVSTYRSVLPLFQRASTAPDTRAGDISIIYALGKMFDPTSVVREGELQLSQGAATWLQQLAANINSQITGEGRLPPELRADILQTLNGQVEALRAPYAQERGRYSGYATDFGFDPYSVVGPDPAEAFKPAGKPVSEMTDEELEAERKKLEGR